MKTINSMEKLDITDLDKNLISTSIKEDNILWKNALDAPFSLHGVFYSKEESVYRRLPIEVAKNANKAIEVLCKHTSGGRLRFKCNSPFVALKITMPIENFGSNLSLLATYGFSVYSDGVFYGNIRPELKHINAQEKGYFSFEGIIYTRKDTIQDIEIYFPIYSMVRKVLIGLKSQSEIFSPTPYKITKPIVFYGSSTTQGACASRSGNDYTALLSRCYKADYINLGFSGNGNCYDSILDYLISIDASVYALDYGMNVKDLEALKNAHYPFYKKLREAKPNTPIVFITRTFYNDPNKFLPRHEIAKATYDKAILDGDKNVYFVDGTILRKDIDFDYATVDNSHPNDVGFYKITNLAKPIFDKIFNG